MPRVNEDLEIDVFPAFAMHRVVGGGEDVHAVDRNAADVMEVAAPPFGPRATELARSHRHLIGVGADDRFEGSGSARRHTRIDVTRRGQGDLPWQAMPAPVFRAPQLAKRLVSDDWERGARQVGAVVEDRLPRSGAA